MQFNFNRKEYERKFLEPGGYVAKIVNVEVKDEIISVYFDIAQGDFAGIYMKEYQNLKGGKPFDSTKWSKKAAANFNFKYDGAKFAFANLLDDVEASNQSFKWKNETDDLKNKLIGVVYKKNIYTDKFGDIREGTDFPSFTSVKNITEKKFSIDSVENNKSTSSDTAQPTSNFNISDDDIQF